MKKPDLKKFPLSPGVYLFRNNKNRVIYVGRATYLRKRVISYFSSRTDAKTAQMVGEAKKIDFIKTDNLIDAVIMEANLIKKHWPKYNIREKDDRSFLYIVIPKIAWPRPLIIRGQQLQKYPPHNAYIFGPFQSYTAVKNLLNILRRVFPYSTCLPAGRQVNSNQRRPCFHAQIGLCPGKCTGAINEKEYGKIMNHLILLLKGEKNKVKKILKKENPDKLEILNRADDSILIAAPNQTKAGAIGRIEGYDISHFAGKEAVGAMVVFRNNEFERSQYRLFKIHEAKLNDDLEAIKETIRRRIKHAEWEYPSLIMVDGGKTQVKTIENVLAENKLNIPVVGIAKPSHYVIPVKTGIHEMDISIDSRLRGNDKYNDKLVFGSMQKPLKDLISLSFPQLLKVRNEAHRFANSLRKKLLKKRIKS